MKLKCKCGFERQYHGNKKGANKKCPKCKETMVEYTIEVKDEKN